MRKIKRAAKAAAVKCKK